MAGTLRLTHMNFYAGPSPGAEALEIEPSTVVVLIGPNNAGKSLALREIDLWSSGKDHERKVVESVGVDFPTDFETAVDLLRPFLEIPTADQLTVDGHLTLQQPTFRPGETARSERYPESNIRTALTSTNEHDRQLLRRIVSGWHTIRLDGRTRFE